MLQACRLPSPLLINDLEVLPPLFLPVVRHVPMLVMYRLLAYEQGIARFSSPYYAPRQHICHVQADMLRPSLASEKGSQRSSCEGRWRRQGRLFWAAGQVRAPVPCASASCGHSPFESAGFTSARTRLPCLTLRLLPPPGPLLPPFSSACGPRPWTPSRPVEGSGDLGPKSPPHDHLPAECRCHRPGQLLPEAWGFMPLQGYGLSTTGLIPRGETLQDFP